MKVFKFLSPIWITTCIFLSGCDFDDDTKHADACVGKYSIVKFEAAVGKKFNLIELDIGVGQWGRLPFDRQYPCDTIYLEMRSDSIPFIGSDTFAIALAKIFYSDTLNKNVRSLKLQLREHRSAMLKPPTNWADESHVEINYKVDRDSVKQYKIPNELAVSDSMRYSIESETPYEYIVSGQPNKGLRLKVKVKEDYKDIRLLAVQIRNKYEPVINNEQLSHFVIQMALDSLSCRLCSGKTFEYSYYILQNLKVEGLHTK